jgi:hypothetical protein
MIRSMAFASILTVSCITFSSQASLAVPLADFGQAASGESLVQTVQSGRCRSWRRECAIRWGWGGSRFRRCLARRNCL